MSADPTPDPDDAIYHNRNSGFYHLKADCPRMKAGSSPRETTRRVLPHRELCSYCEMAYLKEHATVEDLNPEPPYWIVHYDGVAPSYHVDRECYHLAAGAVDEPERVEEVPEGRSLCGSCGGRA